MTNEDKIRVRAGIDALHRTVQHLRNNANPEEFDSAKFAPIADTQSGRRIESSSSSWWKQWMI
eukprot:10900665-Karenia_brevis.AAC.1